MTSRRATTRSQTSKMLSSDKEGKAEAELKEVQADADHTEMDLRRLAAIVEQQADMMVQMIASLDERDFMPKMLDDALEMAKRFRCNQKTESRLNRVHGSDSSDEETKAPATKPIQPKERAHAVAPAEVDYMAKMEESFKKLEAKMDKKWKGPRQGQQGKGRGRGKKTIICFHCHQPDHFARECPYADQTPMFRPLTPGNQGGQTQNQGAPTVLLHTPNQQHQRTRPTQTTRQLQS